MSRIAAVVLLPIDNDRYGLLREMPHGFRPPSVVLCNTDERNRPGVPGDWHIAGPPCREHPRRRALPLWMDSEPVPGGLFVAWFHTDDVLGDDFGSLVDTDDPLEIIEAVQTWRRNGEPLGELVVIEVSP